MTEAQAAAYEVYTRWVWILANHPLGTGERRAFESLAAELVQRYQLAHIRGLI